MHEELRWDLSRKMRKVRTVPKHYSTVESGDKHQYKYRKGDAVANGRRLMPLPIWCSLGLLLSRPPVQMLMLIQHKAAVASFLSVLPVRKVARNNVKRRGECWTDSSVYCCCTHGPLAETPKLADGMFMIHVESRSHGTCGFFIRVTVRFFTFALFFWNIRS